MGDRFDGALASGSNFPIGELSFPVALQSLSIHETLVTSVTTAPGNSEWPEKAEPNCTVDNNSNSHVEETLMLFRAVQDAYHGGIMYVTETCKALQDAIKQSQMTSMLKDNSRCEKYAQAIQFVVQTGDIVLDIGAGTGLLSVLSARAGASRVEAVEMFAPLANVARCIARDNGYERCITVHAAHSNALEWPPERRANVMVSEILDSALLGEGCLSTMRHAREKLLMSNARMIPAKASVFGRVVNSPFLNKFYDLGHDFPMHRTPKDGLKCRGGVVPVPIHIGALRQNEDYQFISDTFKVFDFDFSTDVIVPRHQKINVLRTARGVAHAVISWWVLDLVGDGSITYSTEPGVENWQDHWLQMAYPLPGCMQMATADSDSTIKLEATHDDVSIRFRLDYASNDTGVEACSCGWHALPGGPYRIHELASPERLSYLSQQISNALRTAVFRRRNQTSSTTSAPHIRCIDVADGAVCSLLAAQCVDDLEAYVEIVSADDDEMSAFIHAQVGQHLKRTRNGNVSIESEFEPLYAITQRLLAAKEKSEQEQGAIEQVEDNTNNEWRPFDVVLSEPYTRAMHQYPLATLSNLLVLHRVLSQTGLVYGGTVCVPGQAHIMAQMVKFMNPVIQKAFGKVGYAQGVCHAAYDALWEEDGAQDLFNPKKERDGTEGKSIRRRVSLPLFQYRTKAVSPVSCLQEVNFSNISWVDLSETHNICMHATFADKQRQKQQSQQKSIAHGHSRCNGQGGADAIALWVNYDGLKASRVQRFELLVLDDVEQSRWEKDGVISVSISWIASTALWDINIDSDI